MKMKFLLSILTLGMFMILPTLSYAQYTDEDLEYQGSCSDNDCFGPVSLGPIYVVGNISHIDKIITNTFTEDFGEVTVSIYDKAGNLYKTERVDSRQGSVAIDIQALPAQEYDIVCYIPGVCPQKTEFEIKEEK